MSEPAVVQAEARVTLARARLTDALAALKVRLAPRRVVRDLSDTAKEKSIEAAQAGADAVKARPGVAVGIAALAALVLARKPLVRKISRRKQATPAKPERSNND